MQEYGDVVVKVNEYKRCPDYIIQKFNITNVSVLGYAVFIFTLTACLKTHLWNIKCEK